MVCFQIGREAAARLGDDLDAALDQPQLAPVGFERIERNVGDLVADMLDRLDQVRQA